MGLSRSGQVFCGLFAHFLKFAYQCINFTVFSGVPAINWQMRKSNNTSILAMVHP